MPNLDDVLTGAVSAGDVPFAVAMVGNTDGVTYSGAAGSAKADTPADEGTVFRIFSMTKAIGATAAMILIDRGLLSMDTPVADILPDWDKLRVIVGWDGDDPILRKPSTTATVRHLATHTSGAEYEFWNPDTPRYLKHTGNPSMLGGQKAALLSYPLTSDPGTRWGYGIGVDWLGQIVEAVDGRRIDAFCQQEIFEPLGMADTAFEPDRLTGRLAEVSLRGEDGAFKPVNMAPPPQPEFYGMGHALYSTAPDYLRFLRMVLNSGTLDGARLLSVAGMQQMLADQMQGKTFRTMHSVSPASSADVVMPEGTTHSFAFVRSEADQAGKRRAGSQGWAGICNTHYWVDPASDVAAVLMTQSLPFLEPRFLKTYDAFERGVYADL